MTWDTSPILIKVTLPKKLAVNLFWLQHIFHIDAENKNFQKGGEGVVVAPWVGQLKKVFWAFNSPLPQFGSPSLDTGSYDGFYCFFGQISHNLLQYQRWDIKIFIFRSFKVEMCTKFKTSSDILVCSHYLGLKPLSFSHTLIKLKTR